MPAGLFDHSMLKRLGAALRALSHICTHTLAAEGAEPGGGMAPPVKGLAMGEVLKKALALAHVLLGEGVESLMANLGGRPPAKLASEVARVLPLLLRRVETQAGGIDEASMASVVTLLPPALTASLDTAPLVLNPEP